MRQRLLELFQPGLQPATDGKGEPFLIVGLGNPGREYRATRHNIGFMVIDKLANSLGFTLTKVQQKAIVGQGIHQGSRVILAKPQTFMNLSGQSVVPLLHFYKISPSHLLVIHDDVDLPFGVLRLRPGGGSGGQKGVASIIERLGTQDFARLRVGLGRPPGRQDTADYVLRGFDSSEQGLLLEVIDRAVDSVRTFIDSGLETAMNRYNGDLLKS